MSATEYKGARGVVFDCDGVLADTTACWEDAFERTARAFGLLPSPAQLLELRGAAIDTAAERIAGWSRRSPAAGQVRDLLRAQLMRSIEESELVAFDGAQELLAELHGAHPLGVASNSSRSVLRQVLARLGFTQYFAAAISAEDVERPKPAPDPYLAACAALRIDPLFSLAFEDSEVGVRSALTAGLTVVEVSGPETIAHALPHSPDSALRVSSLADSRIAVLLASPPDAGTVARQERGQESGLEVSSVRKD